ncbi:sphingosine 1-phosphate receptor 1 isoform X1 [Delphinapterus leucas]|uniref:Sphingosine 1-phosphate receptor 1 n=7 Tax=Odontoceti TaxID=9722 RepID=A0A2Y9P133_DELLE|nr:sphingosine 1-phosphate receptor 1 isoform X1 [Delphinapterus leucas]
MTPVCCGFFPDSLFVICLRLRFLRPSPATEKLHKKAWISLAQPTPLPVKALSASPSSVHLEKYRPGLLGTARIMGSTNIPLVKALRSSVSDYVNYDIIVRHYNYTGKLNIGADKENGIKLISVVFILICCFIILENIFVLLTIWKTKKFHRPMYYFIGNLALSDLLAGVAYTANLLLSGATTYKLTPAQWFLREGSMFVALSASVFSLLAIAIERYITMLKMKLHNGSNRFRSFLLISACWVISLILGGLPIMGWNCISTLPSCSTVLPLYHKHYILFCTTVFTLLLLSIVILYCRIYSLVRTRSRRLTFRKNISKASRSSEKSLALLKTVIIVLGVFIACWAPLFILLLLDVGCKVKTCDILFRTEYFLVLAVLNSGTNPIIYTLSNKEMRRAFVRIMSCCKCPSGDSAGKFTRPIIAGMEFSRSKSDNSSHPQKDDGDNPETIMSSGNVNSSS